MQRLSAQNQGSRRQYTSNLTAVNEEAEPLEVPSLPVDSKGPADPRLHEAPGKYPYPFATNRSKNAPPRPCHNCGSNLHYDRDCESWRKRGKTDSRKLPTNVANMAYEEAYIAMLQGEEETCSIHCDTYYAMVDTLTAVETLVAEITVEPEEYTWDDFPPPLVSLRPSEENTQIGNEENSWLSLKTKIAEPDSIPDRQFKDIYQPAPL